VDEQAAVPWEDGHGDTKGWDRASIANRSAKPYRPDISQRDLTLPNEASQGKAFVLCFLCAVGATFLYVCIPLWVFGLFVEVGAWMALVPLTALVALTVLLYKVSTRETRELRVLAKEL
jgi:hypothetical protein